MNISQTPKRLHDKAPGKKYPYISNYGPESNQSTIIYKYFQVHAFIDDGVKKYTKSIWMQKMKK